MRLVTDAIIASLTAAPLVVGDGEKPAAGGFTGARDIDPFVGYVVVHPMVGGGTDGPILAPDADMTPLYQLSSYGATRSQCELVADKAHAVMVANAFAIAGVKVMRVVVDDLAGAMRLDELQPPEWQATGRYFLMTTPT